MGLVVVGACVVGVSVVGVNVVGACVVGGWVVIGGNVVGGASVIIVVLLCNLNIINTTATTKRLTIILKHRQVDQLLNHDDVGDAGAAVGGRRIKGYCSYASTPAGRTRTCCIGRVSNDVMS